MEAISNTDSNLAVTSDRLKALTDNLGNMPVEFELSKRTQDDLKRKLKRNDEATETIALVLADLKKKVDRILSAREGIDWKTVEGWRKLLPYIILGGLALWGMIREALQPLLEKL